MYGLTPALPQFSKGVFGMIFDIAAGIVLGVFGLYAVVGLIALFAAMVAAMFEE